MKHVRLYIWHRQNQSNEFIMYSVNIIIVGLFESVEKVVFMLNCKIEKINWFVEN